MLNMIGNVREGMQRFANRVKQFNRTSKVAFGLTIAVAGTSTGTVLASTDTDKDLGLQEIYHVYFGEEHIGSVEDKKEIEQFIEERKQEAQSNHDGIELIPSEEVNYVRELVFQSSPKSNDVLTNLDEQLTFATSAIEITVNDQLIGYVKDLEMANEAINQVVNEFLPEKLQLDEYTLVKEEDEQFEIPVDLLPKDFEVEEEETEQEEDPKTVVLPETVSLKNDSATIDVNFTEDVVISEERVNPTKLLEVEQLTKLIQRGVSIEKEKSVEDEESIEQVADKNNLSMEELLDLNPELDDTEIIQAGATVNVKEEKNFIDVLVTEERTEEESIDFETITKETDQLYRGKSEVEEPGEKGKKVITYKVTMKNNEIIAEEKIDEEVVKEPTDKVVLKGTKQVSNQGTGSLGWPAVGGTITSKMGPRWSSYHKGIDIAGVGNRSILAADNGTVVQAGWDGAYGNRVVINHNNGLRTTYSHLSSISVSSGQTVKKGQTIGQMGATGRSTGVHLHFEVYKNGSLVDPLNYISR